MSFTLSTSILFLLTIYVWIDTERKVLMNLIFHVFFRGFQKLRCRDA